MQRRDRPSSGPLLTKEVRGTSTTRLENGAAHANVNGCRCRWAKQAKGCYSRETGYQWI